MPVVHNVIVIRYLEEEIGIGFRRIAMQDGQFSPRTQKCGTGAPLKGRVIDDLDQRILCMRGTQCGC